MIKLAAHRIRQAFRHIRRKLPQVAGQEVGEDAVGGDASDPRLMGRGTDREAAAERDADDGHTIEAEVVEDSSDWPVPLPGEHQTGVLQGSTLAGPLKADHLVTGSGDRQHHGEELLAVAVEASEHEHGSPARGAEAICGQVASFLWHAGHALGADLVDVSDQLEEPLAGRRLALIAGHEEELRRPVAERGVEPAPPCGQESVAELQDALVKSAHPCMRGAIAATSVTPEASSS